MHARLPQSMLDTDTLDNLTPGTVAYTVPWAMSVDEHGYCWLNSKYSFCAHPMGTVEMRVERKKDGDYWVTQPRGYKYQQGTRNNSTWFSIPVAKIVEG